MLLGENPVLSSRSATGRWIAAAAEDPGLRLARAVPEEIDFRPWAGLLRSLQSAALPVTQLGSALLLGSDGLEVATEMTWRSRYPAYVDGKQFVGTVHVHPKEASDSFDAADLASFLRSDYPGFLDLLVAAESASAVVRTRRFLYISGERVDRDPLLLERSQPGFRAHGTTDPASADKAVSETRAAVRAVCHLYELALYRGSIDAPLRLVSRPR